MATHVLGGAEFGDWERAGHYQPLGVWAETASHHAGNLALNTTLAPLGSIYEVGDSQLRGDGIAIGTMAMTEQLLLLRRQLPDS
jgi:hypothetical protein